MPDTTPISLSDTALATSTAHAVSVSRGAGQVPYADANFAWNSTNRQQVLNGQASGFGGDRWNLQGGSGLDLLKADTNGTLWFNLQNNASIYTSSITPQFNAGYPTTYDVNGISSINTDLTTYNNITSHGYGLRLGSGINSWRIGQESNWLTSNGYFQAECHLGGYYPAPFNPTAEIRCWTMNVHKDTGNAQTQTECSSMGQLTEASVTQIWKSERNGVTGDYAFTIYNGATGTNGYPYQFSSGTAGDTLSVGRSNVDVTLNVGGGNGHASKFVMPPGGQAVIGSTDVVPSAAFAILPTSSQEAFAINTPSGSTQTAISVAQNSVTALSIGASGQITSTSLAGTSYAVNLTGNSSSYPIAFPNNGFLIWKDTGGSDRIVLGISSDNNTHLISPPGQNILLSPGNTTALTLAAGGAASFVGAIGVNGASPSAKAASPGVASGTDAAVINAISTILRNIGFCS